MDNKTLKESLMDEILKELQSLNDLEPGSVEQQQVVENVNKLSKTIIEMEAKSEEKTDRKKERLVKLGLGAGALGLTAWQIILKITSRDKILKFEETGSISSSTGRRELNEIFKIIK